MKIKEVIERECCEQGDMVKIGINKFRCKHCKKMYTKERYSDAAGDMDTRLVPFNTTMT